MQTDDRRLHGWGKSKARFGKACGVAKLAELRDLRRAREDKRFLAVASRQARKAGKVSLPLADCLAFLVFVAVHLIDAHDTRAGAAHMPE